MKDGMKSGRRISGLYAIADLGVLSGGDSALRDFAAGLQAAGVRTVQLRAKCTSPEKTLEAAAMLRSAMSDAGATLLMNDRADLAVLAGFDGVHVGQGDLDVEDARQVLQAFMQGERLQGQGETGARQIVGVSTHTDEQVRLAAATSADYVAIGPVFATRTKLDASPVVGLEGVRRARALTVKPIVAIGGITRKNAASVIAAGADALAVISGLLVPGETVEQVARDFLEFFR